MKPSALRFLVCPACKGALGLRGHLQQGPEVVEGSLSCTTCSAEYRIVRGVPRFAPMEDYASSFRYQWNRFRTVQLDSMNGSTESERAGGDTEENRSGRVRRRSAGARAFLRAMEKAP